MNSPPYRRGNAEYLKFNGHDRMIRTWQPAENAWRYTNLGRIYFSKIRIPLI